MIRIHKILFKEEFGPDLKHVIEAKDHWARLDNNIEGLPPGDTVCLDLSGLEFIGYSYAKQTIRRCLEKLLDWEYQVASIVVAYIGADFDVKLMDVQYALSEAKLSTWFLGDGGEPEPFGYLVQDTDSESDREKQKKEKLLSIVRLLQERPYHTNEIADRLEIKLANTNKLLDELAAQKMIERKKEVSQTGGPLYLNAVLLTDKMLFV